MAARRHILIWLVAAHVVATPLALWAFDPFHGDGIPEMTFIALLFSQGNLLAFWAVLGGKPSPWRVAATIVILGAAFAIAEYMHSDPIEGVVLMILLQFIASGVVLLVVRWSGLRLFEASADLARHRLQFSLRSMLAWTTGLAVICGTFSWMPSLGGIMWREAIVCLTCTSGLGVLALHAVLNRRLHPVWIGVVLLAVGSGSALTRASSHSPPVGAIVVLFISLALWTAGSAVVVRAAGYRLAWRPAGTPIEPPAA